VGIIGAIMAWFFVHESKSGGGFKNFDWWGALSLGSALTALVLVLDQGSTWGWFSLNSVLAYFLTLIFGLIFVWLESNAEDPICGFEIFPAASFLLVPSLIILWSLWE